MGFMQTESVLQSKNRSGPAKNRFSVALVSILHQYVPQKVLNKSLIFFFQLLVISEESVSSGLYRN